MTFALISLFAAGCFGDAAAFAAAPAAPAPVAIAATAPPTVKPPSAKPTSMTPAARAVVSAPKTNANGVAFADVDDKTLVDRVLASIEAITTLKSDFTQVAPSGATSTGKFYLRRPGLLRFEFDAPTPLLIVATGGTVFVRDSALETTDSYPVGRTPLKYLLRKRVELGDAKVVRVDRGDDSVAVTFASDKEEPDGELSIVMAGPALELREWIVRDPQNGVTFVTLSNVIAGGQIPNRMFAAPETGSAFLKD